MRPLISITALFVAGHLALAGTLHGQAAGTGKGETADVLTLAEVLDLARERNPRLAAARALTEAAAARESWAGLLPDPTLQLGVMNFSIPGLDVDMANSMAPSIQAMQRIPFPGKLGLADEIAGTTTEIAEARADEAWWDVRTRTARTFYRLYEIDRRIEVMEETLGLLQQFETVARSMYTAGAGRQSDVLRANVEVSRMDAETTRMRAMREGAAARLNALLDRPAGTPVPSPVLGRLPRELPPPDTLEAWAAFHRPALAGHRLDVERAGTRRELAGRQIWPDFTVGFQYGQRSVGGDVRRMGSAMIGFSVPVFAGRRQLRERAEAEAMERMSRARLVETEARVDARIGELAATLRRTRALVDLYRDEILPQAEANVESSLSSYRVGEVDFTTLVDAQMAVNRFEGDLFALVAEYGTAVAELEWATGRELPPGADLLTDDEQ